MLAGCGGSEPPIGAPAAIARSPDVTPARAIASHIRTASSSYQVLHSFGSSASDGESPYAALLDLNGTLYGTTAGGGSHAQGTVFAIKTDGKEHVLYSFGSSSSDGEYPYASLTAVNGTLYGTTNEGGASGAYGKHGFGTVFSVSTAGVQHGLHSFGRGNDGAYPFASLIDVKGKLYGTTAYGGGYDGTGTVFRISTAGAEHVLYTFDGTFSDGLFPFAGLLDVKGRGLFGVTAGMAISSMSSYAEGATVFSIMTNGKRERVLYNFNTNGHQGNSPNASPIDVNGTLYGTTTAGGAHRLFGTVYSISTTGKNFRLLYSFGKSNSDGEQPYASLIDVKGTLYGTTVYGGSHGEGTVFSISTSGAEHVLYSFGGSSFDGEEPYASLIDVRGTLYGTTALGGQYHQGTVFALRLQ